MLRCSWFGWLDSRMILSAAAVCTLPCKVRRGFAFGWFLKKTERLRGTADRPNSPRLAPAAQTKGRPAVGTDSVFENHPSQIKAAPCMAERRPLCLTKLPSDPTIQNNRNRNRNEFQNVIFFGQTYYTSEERVIL